MTSPALLPSNAVEVSGARTFTTSLMVAEVFGKRHDNVLRDIEDIKTDCPADFNALNFEGVDYLDAKGERRPMIELSKDGFTLLAMGYTGAKAMQFKLAYIARFNEMEARLHGAASPQVHLESARFILTFSPDGRAHLTEIPADSSVCPMREWPGIIGSPDFPRALLPEILEAVGERMKDAPSPRSAPRALLGDGFAQAVAAYLAGRQRVSIAEILQSLGMNADRAAQTRTGNVLRRLGWSAKQETLNGARVRVYRPLRRGAA